MLDKQASAISENLDDFGARGEEATKVLREVAATLRSLEAKLQRNKRGPVRRLWRTVNAYNPVTKGETGLRSIYNELNGLIWEIRYQVEDLESL
jgi:hypothetical protein